MGKKRRSRPEHLAEKLLAIRSKLGVSQIQMAKLLKADAQYKHVSEWERGRREPNLSLILKYARLAEVPVENLIDDDLDLPL
jgi:transcriptional regulator with XRE-family HTH domain